MAVVTLDNDWEELHNTRKEIMERVLGKERASKLIDIPDDEEEITDKELLGIIENAGTLENDRQ